MRSTQIISNFVDNCAGVELIGFFIVSVAKMKMETKEESNEAEKTMVILLNFEKGFYERLRYKNEVK